MYIVILAGGAGARFWPLSRRKQPKQLMSVFGGKSMLQRTVERVLPLKPKGILVVTHILQAAETARQLNHLEGVQADIIAEPIGRNTAPAIGLAASIIAGRDPDAVMAVLPADHFIRDEDVFRATIMKAKEAAMDGLLVTLGIKPDRPETGYGYLEADEMPNAHGSYRVKRFVEKPALEKALIYLSSGKWYWNSGMFVWQARAILREIEKHMPELSACLRDIVPSHGKQDDGVLPQIESMYDAIESTSIDYGVMEKAEHVAVIPADFGWSDVGSWRAFPEIIAPDESENVIMNAENCVNINSRECIVYGGGKLVALVGVQNLIIVNTGDAVLICAKEQAQEVKKVVEELDRRGLTEYI